MEYKSGKKIFPLIVINDELVSATHIVLEQIDFQNNFTGSVFSLYHHKFRFSSAAARFYRELVPDLSEQLMRPSAEEKMLDMGV